MKCVDAGNVFVHLFMQTKTRYVLTNRKLQYLLVVAQMSRLTCDNVLFEDDIRVSKNGFLLDVIADNFVSGSSIVDGTTSNVPIGANPESFVLPYTKKKIFQISVLPSAADKDLLIQVFLAFGGYGEDDLGALLNDFRALRKGPSFGVVAKESIRKYFVDALGKKRHGDNAVFVFIKKQYIERLKEQKAAERVRAANRARAEASAIERAAALAAEKVAKEKTAASAMTESAFAAPAAPVVPVVPVVPVAPIVPAAKSVLKGLNSIRSVVVGKKYTVFVESPVPGRECMVSVFSPALGRNVPGSLNKLSETLYSFTFEGVASDIRVSARFI